MSFEQFRGYCLSKCGATEDTPFDANTLTFKVCGKIFAITNISTFDFVNLKVDPEEGVEIREKYPWVLPGYHMNKRHWVSVSMQGGVREAVFRGMIDRSYALVVAKLPKRDRLSLNR